MVPGANTVLLLLLPLIVGLVALLTQPGAIRGLLAVRVKASYLLWAAAAVKFVQLSGARWSEPLVEPHGGLIPNLGVLALGIAFTLANICALPASGRMALGVLAAGFASNSLVKVLNGAMPFSTAAARTVGLPDDMIVNPGRGYEPVSSRTMLPALADVIPVPVPQSVVSVGDVLILIGIAWLVVALARHEARSSADTRTNEAPDGTTVLRGGDHA